MYDIVFVFLAILYFPYLVILGKWHPGFKTRFGCLGSVLAGRNEAQKCIWIHAVSVGEVLAITDLIRKLKKEFPQHTIICSTVTKTGNQLAQEQLGGDCLVIYAPLDFSWIVRKFITAIKPAIYISTETEIWPNLYSALHKASVPVIQINGRISDKAYRGYNRVRVLTKRVLACVDIFCMQSPLDADRIERLGAAPEKVRIVGNLKFDNVPGAAEIKKEDLGFGEDEDLLIAGSTHPGEEDILINAYHALIAGFPGLRLVIAPRHIERADFVIGIVEKQGYHPIRFSEIKDHKGDTKSIVVVDTIGHLRNLYSLAKIVFIGKTLTVGGGQNMIESACLGKPTIVGPMTQNFKDVVAIFLKSEGLVQVDDPRELLEEMRKLLSNPEKARAIGKAAQQTVENHQGATLKTIKEIRQLLGYENM